MKDYNKNLEFEDLFKMKCCLLYCCLFGEHRKQSLFTINVVNVTFKDHQLILLPNGILNYYKTQTTIRALTCHQYVKSKKLDIEN